jgi:hypothetical protein
MSRNPYHVDGQEPIMQKSVFVFMDILGYKEMILKSETSGLQPELFQSLYRALNKGRKWLGDELGPQELRETLQKFKKKDFYALKAFTDNIVIGWPFRGDSDGWSQFNDLCFTLAWFQFELIREGFFIRGAVSVGDAYVDEIAVFGSALTDAHHGESFLARDPRIILTESAVEAVERYLDYGHPRSSAVKTDVLKDSDGQYFLNYLYYVFFVGDKGNYKDLFLHKTRIEEKLKEHEKNPSVWSKYAWAAGYHNFFCDLHSSHSSNDIKISAENKIEVELFRATPELIK